MKILSRPNGNAEEYGKWSVNPYLGCTHGCLYCYLKQGVWANALGGDKPRLKKGLVSEEHAYHVAMAEILEHRDEIIKDGGLFMSFVTDPCAPETSGLMIAIAQGANLYHIPVTILTKAGINTPYGESFGSLVEKDKNIQWTIFSRLLLCLGPLAFGVTLTGHDELEPNAAPNIERIKLLGQMKDKPVIGGKCHLWASIEPVIDFESSFDMIQQALDAGCEHFKIGLMTKNTKVCRNGFEIGGHKFAHYDIDECCQFIYSVMAMTEGKATVYWKESFMEFLQQPVHGMTVREHLSQWTHSVGKDWSMFNDITKEEYGKH